MARKRLTTVIAAGDRRESLVAIRDRLAAELETAVGRDAATVAKELREVIRELDALPGAREESRLDQLAARRADREARYADATGS